MKNLIIIGALIHTSFLLFPEAAVSQSVTECPATILIGKNGVREFVWRDGTVEGESVGYSEGNFWVIGNYYQNQEGKWQWRRGEWKQIRSGWVYIQEQDGTNNRWLSCSELHK